MIVPVDERNIAAAGAVHAASWRESHSFCTPEFVAAHTAETQAEYLRREMDAGKALFLLLDPEPVGVVSVQEDLIENLYVLPEKQGRGYGSALLEHAAARCPGTPRLWLLNINEKARRFYEARGFRETGERRELKNGLAELEMTRSRLTEIRRAEAESHTAAYESLELYAPGSWLSKPVKALGALLPLYAGRPGLRVLDLGSGVGRNAIACARELPGCSVECVDILPVAIEKLLKNAEKMGVGESVRGITAPVDGFEIERNRYDLILAASVLEHLDARASVVRKLREISAGIRPGGAVLIVMNTGVREWDRETGEPLPPQFEVNLPPEEVRTLLGDAFCGWEILWDRCIHYEYQVPRRDRTAVISAEVVTFTARRPQ
ncbi:MAG: GNAT family N-acetyltransferase [Oscillospiraceae bacterium]|nr:GNAT family N-acetyltransferase [Oscillospiraceae bacterium]